MDNRAIGVFDSGLGGLTTVRELCRILPNEDIIYFGDTGRVPYGTRSKQTIRKYAKQDIRFLLLNKVKMIVVACNTAATAIAGEMDMYDIPFADALTPAAEAAADVTKNGIVGVIGTPATINSNAYETALHHIDSSLNVVSNACPLFVPLVENGFAGKDNKVAKLVAEQYLEYLKKSGADTLILGCTHYPIMKEVIGGVMGEGVTLIDSGKEAARAAKEKLVFEDMLGTAEKVGCCRYYVSDDPSDFAERVEVIFGKPIYKKAQKIDIDSY